MISTVEILEYDYNLCFAHFLHNFLMHALNDEEELNLNPLIKKCRKITKFFTRSAKNS